MIDDRRYRSERHTLEDLRVEQQRVESFLERSFDLRESLDPRMFVALPESIMRGNDPADVVLEKLRLYFLCECGDHCAPKPPKVYKRPEVFDQLDIDPVLTTFPVPAKRRIHLIDHEGYEISCPAKFYDRYGCYVIGMLRILRHCLTLKERDESGMVPVHLNATEVRSGIDFLTSNVMVAADMVTTFLAQRFELQSEQHQPQQQLKNDGSIGQPGKPTFTNFEPLQSSDLRRLDTYFSVKTRIQVLGGLHRVFTSSGHVKWVCLKHYLGIYPSDTMRESFQGLLPLVANLGGLHDQFHGKARVNITSSTTAQEVFTKYARLTPTVSDLDVKLHWKVESKDQIMIVDKIAEANLRVLKLDLSDSYEIVGLPWKLGKGRYNPLLGLFSNKKLKTLYLHNISLLGPRSSKFPPGHSPSSLQSFHFMSIIKNDDDSRLAEIVTLCPELIDLRLEEELQGRAKSIPYGGQSLKELVSIGTVPGLYALQDYIRRSITTLEVPCVENYHRRDFVFDPTPMTLDHHTALLFAKLTHLDIQTAISANPLQLLSILL
ncbi:hypothetical protein BGX23_000922, partial [Mortierella sp. AD031]